MKYILALDQDTTSSRAIVFDRAGRVKAVAQKGFPQIFPKPGWGEHDAGAIWKTQLATAKAALKKARLTALGAAYLAGLAVGFWKSQKDIATQWRQDKRFISKMKPSARRKLIANWDKALGRSRNWED